MAETFLNALGRDQFIASSAGFEASALNPIVVEAMKEIGFDISKNKTQSVFECYKAGKLYNYVITVCDETNAERCPIFPGYARGFTGVLMTPQAFKGAMRKSFGEQGS
jgi:arsenate reductase